MATIQLLNGTEKIKDSYGKINTSLTNLNNDKLEKNAAEKLNFSTSGPVLTISDGAITVTRSYHVIDTEGGAANDDLTTINGGITGDILILRSNDSTRNIYIKGGGQGNIYSFDRSDIFLDTISHVVMFIKVGNNWYQLGTNGVNHNGDTMTGRLEFSGNQMGLRFRNGDSDTSAEFDFPEASTANVTARFFRFTNSSGNKQFTLARGDGTANPAFAITNGAITRINGIVVTITAYAGNPNGNVAAPPGSICLDTANGVVYRKASDTGNTGWQAMA